MKKILSGVLVLAMVLSLAGCAGGADETTAAAEETTAAAEETTAAAEETTAAAEETKQGNPFLCPREQMEGNRGLWA